MTLESIYPVLITERLQETRGFYADVLGLDAVFESDWFVQLVAPGAQSAQIGLVAAGHESIPDGFRAASGGGMLVTVELDDVDGAYERARALGVPIELPLRDEDWGQRHFIARDPSGFLLDVVRVIPVTSPEAAAQYAPSALPPS